MSLTRRRLLKVSAQAGLGSLTLAAGRGLLGETTGVAAQTTGAREIRLETREVPWELAPGKVVRALTYNGRIPGPEIRLKEGEFVRVVLHNGLAAPTAIHWHGIDEPTRHQVHGVPHQLIPAGATFTYEFLARPAGTRWYHRTHFGEGIDLGLAAPLIIEPAQPDPFPFDREVTVVLDDWATGTSRPLPLTLAGTAGARGSAGGMMARMSMGPMGCGMPAGSPATSQYDSMSINGKAFPATEPLSIREGERVRFRLVNASAMHTHLVRLAGHSLQVTHTDGNPLQEAVEVDALPIAPAERYDVLIKARRPGVWPLYCAQPGHAIAGEQVMVVYEGHESTRPAPPTIGASTPRVWRYELGRGRPLLPAASGAVRNVRLMLSGGMMQTDAWTINGKRYPATDPLDVRQGDHVRVLLTNMSMASHPIHLHGQSFNVVAVNGARLTAPLVKDTVDVEPHMGSVLIEFPALYPGAWMLHCHKEVHTNGGMFMLVRVAERT